MAAVYVAAGLSFLAGVVRDGLLVQRVSDYGAVFGVMYAAALASGFSVNAVTLGRSLGRSSRSALVSLALGLFVLIGLLWQRLDVLTLLLIAPVPIAYVVGAVHSRRLLESGHVLIARLRDGVASALMALLVLVGVGLVAFPVAVVVATMLFALLMRRLAPAPAHGLESAPQSLAHYASILFYTNVASLIVNAWALWANQLPGDIWGQPVPVAVRVAMYAFQVLSLPSVLLVRLHHPVVVRWPWQALTWCCLALALAMAFAPLAWSLILFPLASVATLYCAVLHLRRTSQAD